MIIKIIIIIPNIIIQIDKKARNIEPLNRAYLKMSGARLSSAHVRAITKNFVLQVTNAVIV